MTKLRSPSRDGLTREIWLRPNRRVLTVVACCLGGLLGALLLGIWLSPSTIVRAGLALVTVPLMILLTVFAFSLAQPRIAYLDHALLVYLRSGGPIRIPIEVVECFFLGRGDSHLPNRPFSGTADRAETSTVVVRLAEAAQEWSHGEVQPALGQWCDGYITIRGTWCEPISGDLVKQLNHRLAEVKRNSKQSAEQVSR